MKNKAFVPCAETDVWRLLVGTAHALQERAVDLFTIWQRTVFLRLLPEAVGEKTIKNKF